MRGLAALAAVLSLAPAPARAALLLSASADKLAYAPAEPIHLRLTLTNAGEKSVQLFQPDSVNRLWPTWSVEGSVRRPDGKECALEPEVRYSLLGVPRLRHFRSLLPGGVMDIPIAFRSSEPREGTWTALLPISSWEARQAPRALARRRGFAGEAAFVGSGHQEFLSLADPGDLFREKGVYTLRFVYHNKARGCLEREAGKNLHVPMPAAWTGTLETTLMLEVK